MHNETSTGEWREKKSKESHEILAKKCDERHECTYSRSSRDCKQDKLKELHNDRNYSQVVKIQIYILESSSKQLVYKGSSIKLAIIFSSETMQYRQQWNDLFKVLIKSCQGRIL